MDEQTSTTTNTSTVSAATTTPPMSTTQPAAAAPAATQAPSNETLMGILAYLSILVVVPFAMAKDDAFVKFHIKQGLLLVIAEVVVWVLTIFAWRLAFIFDLVDLAVLVLAVIGIINVVNHKTAELPLIGSLAKHFTF